MNKRLYPLRLVVKRENGWDYLECGHDVGTDYRYQIKRRCRDCEPIDKVMEEKK